MSASQPPTVSVVIPHKPGLEEVRVLESLAAVAYPRDRYEVIVAEGFHPSKQRNQAVAQSRGEIVVFFDDDVAPDAKIFERFVADFAEFPSAAVVGGPSVIPPTDNFWQQCFARVMRSRVTMGRSIARYESNGQRRATNESELILCNVAMRREAFLKAGGFDERLWPNEENEMFERLQRFGYQLVYDPEAIVYRSHRPTLGNFVRQLLGYGRGRMGQTIIRPSVTCMIRMVPAAFVLYLASLLAWHPWWYELPLAAYALLIGSAAAYHAVHNRTLAGGLMSLWLLPLAHIAYGCGLLSALFKRMGWHEEPPGASVKLRVVKSFGP
ncbi:MAG: glycosyltransferase family 2 protein [Verrucomicrobiia bacterium]|jgi:cellulose synthase/poly-beta-1,6-N-acetylglucosamine synthase-like glycosyltransferase